MTAPDGSANSRRLDLEAEVLGVVQVERETDELAQRARAEHEAVGAALRDTVRHAMAAGEILLKAKAAMPHGLFGDWLETKAGVPRRTAQVYMRLARELPKLPQEKRNAVAHLSLRDAIAELSRTSGKVAKLPPPVLDTALDEARREPIKTTVTRATNQQHYVRPPAPAVDDDRPGPLPDRRDDESDVEYDERIAAQARKELGEFLDSLAKLPRGPDDVPLAVPKPTPKPEPPAAPPDLVDELLGDCFIWKRNPPEATDRDVLGALREVCHLVESGALDPETEEVREKRGVLGDGRRVLILTPSDHPGFTYVTVLDNTSGEATGFTRPLRDDAIEELVSQFWNASMPTRWHHTRSTKHRENPHLIGSEPIAPEEQREQLLEIEAEANRRLDEFGYQGPRSSFLEEREL
jgi:hypothetical protein